MLWFADVMSIGIESECGLCEFALSPEFGIRPADSVFRLKKIVKEIGNANGLDVTFMAMPYHEINNALHFNHSLWTADESSNAFYDQRTPDNHLSETFYHWLAGLIEHGPGIAALVAPTVNCYRCFTIPYIALFPKRIDWGMDHRKASYRVRSMSPTATFIESRLVTGSANPYLVLAAMVAAGLDGINRRLACPSARDPQAKLLPKSLDEALLALENDKVLVEALGQQFIHYFTTTKRDIEIQALQDSIPSNSDDNCGYQKERDMYYRLL